MAGIIFVVLMLLISGCASGVTQPPSKPSIEVVPSATVEVVPSATSTPAVVYPTPVIGGTWKWVFGDEFEGDTLDKTKWTTCYWWTIDGCTIISNNELEWYQPENVSVRDGRLILEAREQEIEGLDGKIFPYTSGMVTTGRATSDMTEKPRFAFQYGYVEMRAKIPAGQGLWPAFWMLPLTHESRPEIDIMEILGHEPQTIKFYYHYRDSAGERADIGDEWVGPDFSQDWHIFGVEWARDRIVWYVDGTPRYEFTDQASVPSEPMYILLNLAVGGDWPGPPDASTVFPSQYQIDYVRVYQRAD